MGRISHHLTVKDYKKTRQRQLDEQRILCLEKTEKEIQEQEDREFLEYFKSNWRKELVDEGMTTTNLNRAIADAPDDPYNNPIVTTSAVTLNYANAINDTRREITLGTFDLSAVDQMYVSGVRASGSGTIYGWSLLANNRVVISGADGYYYIGTRDLALFKSGKVTLKVKQDLAPEYDHYANDPAFDGWSIRPMAFYRTTPTNVFVPLDDPESSSFIRTGNSNLTPEQRKQKLRERLEASDEYLVNQFGRGFPGTGLDPKAGEAGVTPGVEIAQDPYTGYGETDAQERRMNQQLLKWYERGGAGNPSSPSIQKQIQNLRRSLLPSA